MTSANSAIVGRPAKPVAPTGDVLQPGHGDRIEGTARGGTPEGFEGTARGGTAKKFERTASGGTTGVADARAAPNDYLRWWTPWRTGLVILAIGTAFIALGMLASGASSDYYGAIALSMSRSWSNFFFGAMDPAGTVSLDKIPGSFWIPALFVKVFGYSIWTVNAPNALAMIGAVLLVAFTGKQIATPAAGLIAGTIVATTPILAAVSRSNQPESFFVLALALVAWAAARALTRASAGWLIAAGALVALAFQTYMLEAWAVWPALALAYLLLKKRTIWRRLGELALAGVLSLGLSITWIVIVALVPAQNRPWVGSTLMNNPFEMVFGYNGLGRFGSATQSDDYLSFTPPFSGDPGIFRLFNTQLAGQVAWLIPTALLAVVILALLRFDRSMTVFLGAWLLTLLGMFSLVAGMHQFYTAVLAIPLGLLIGIAFGTARARRLLWPQVSLVVAASVTAFVIALRYPDYLSWMAVAQLAVAAIAVALLCAPRLRSTWWVAVIATAGMLLTPAAWAVDVMHHPNSINPVAGDGSAALSAGTGAPAGATGSAGAGGGTGPGGTAGQRSGPVRQGGSTGQNQRGAGGGQALTGGGAQGAAAGSTRAAVLSYVQAHSGGAQYALAVFGAQEAAGYIIAGDGMSVMPIGGFNGRDAAPTLHRFEELVAAGDVPFVLIGPSRGIHASTIGTVGTQIRAWVVQNCSVVSDETLASEGLYACGP